MLASKLVATPKLRSSRTLERGRTLSLQRSRALAVEGSLALEWLRRFRSHDVVVKIISSFIGNVIFGSGSTASMLVDIGSVSNVTVVELFNKKK